MLLYPVFINLTLSDKMPRDTDRFVMTASVSLQTDQIIHKYIYERVNITGIVMLCITRFALYTFLPVDAC